MRFLVRLANKKHFKPGDAKSLAKSAYGAVNRWGADVGNLRVSSSAVELDLLLPSNAKIESSVNSLEVLLGRKLTLRELDTQPVKVDPARAIREGIELFNAERYWESHEALESAWRIASGSEKDILQGIILVAASLVHAQKGNVDVSVSVMRRAVEKLTGYSGTRFGIDMDNFRQEIRRIVSSGEPVGFKIQSDPDSS